MAGGAAGHVPGMTATTTSPPPTGSSSAAGAIAPRSRATSAVALALWIGLCQLAGLVGVPFTGSEPGGWYDQLDKAVFHPPQSVFGPVWIALYTVIGVAAWMVWRHRPSPARTTALVAFAVQLVLNAMWTPIFFGLERPTLALIEIVVMLAAVAFTIRAFAAVDRWAALLLVPYAGWIAFATLLNASIVALN